MPTNQSLTLKTACKNDFVLPAIFLSVLVIVVALSSSQPLPMTLLVGVFLGATWYQLMSVESDIPALKLISIIFRDGTLKLKLKSDEQPVLEGIISGQQWVSPWVSVLRFISSGKHHSLLVFSAQQNADQYRRLVVWLKQGLLNNNEERV
jgi:hypothetical protein